MRPRWLLAIALFACARAEAAPPAAPPASPAPKPVALIVDMNELDALGPRMRTAARATLDRDARVAIREIDLATVSGAAALATSDAAAAKAASKFHEMDLDVAATSAHEAMDGYEEHLPDLAARPTGLQPLRDVHITLSKILFFNGDFEGAKNALSRAFAIDPKLGYSKELFPKQMKRTVVEARLLFDALGAAKVQIESTPAGGEVIINGARTGQKTPMSVEIAAGPNAIAVALAGYETAHAIIDVGAAGQPAEPKVALPLKRLDGPEARAREATSAMASGTDTQVDLAALAQSLSVDGIVLVHGRVKPDQSFHLVGAVWTKKRGGIALKAERDGVAPSIETETESLVRALDEPLVEPEVVVVAKTEDHDGIWPRFRHSKAFWYVVGAAGVVVVGAAVGIGVGVTEAHRHSIEQQAVIIGGH